MPKPASEVSWYADHLERSLALINAVAPSRAGAIIGVGAGASTLVDDLLASGHRHITVLDRAVFHFLTAEPDRAAHSRLAAKAINRGGHIIMATFALNGPDRCSGLDTVRYDGASLAREFPGFTLQEEVADTHTTPGGGQQHFVYCLLRKGDRGMRLPGGIPLLFRRLAMNIPNSHRSVKRHTPPGPTGTEGTVNGNDNVYHRDPSHARPENSK